MKVSAREILAGARGVPFLPSRGLLGSDHMRVSAARTLEDPYTGEPVSVVPALNPDVAFVHVHQADETGKSRIFGTNLFALEAAPRTHTGRFIIRGERMTAGIWRPASGGSLREGGP